MYFCILWTLRDQQAYLSSSSAKTSMVVTCSNPKTLHQFQSIWYLGIFCVASEVKSRCNEAHRKRTTCSGGHELSLYQQMNIQGPCARRGHILKLLVHTLDSILVLQFVCDNSMMVDWAFLDGNNVIYSFRAHAHTRCSCEGTSAFKHAASDRFSSADVN